MVPKDDTVGVMARRREMTTAVHVLLFAAAMVSVLGAVWGLGLFWSLGGE